MQYTQKALIYNRVDFVFGDKALDVKIDDGRLVLGFTAPYHEIGAKRSVRSFPERAFLRLGLAMLLALLAGYALVRNDITMEDGLTFCIIGALGMTFCLASRYATFDATIIPVASGHNILVFHNSEHHLILSEIYKRRKADLIRLHGEVDALNHAQLEIKKFLWLKEEGVITDVEFEEAQKKIADLTKQQGAV